MMNAFKQEWNEHARKWMLLTMYLETAQKILNRNEDYRTVVLERITNELLLGDENAALKWMELINGLLYLKESLPTVTALIEYTEKKDDD